MSKPTVTLLIMLSAFFVLELAAFSSPGEAALQPGFDQKQAAVLGTGLYKTRSWGLALKDFTGDGIPDIVSGDTNGDLHLYAGNGDGTFAVRGIFLNVGLHNAYALAAGDFDGDGKADLVLCRMNGDNGLSDPTDGELRLYLGKGDGTFQTTPQIVGDAGTDAMVLAATDVDGDGDLDLVSGDQLNSEGGGTADVLLFRNGGTSTTGQVAWSKETIIAAPKRVTADPESPPYFPPRYYFQSYGLAFGDMDGDGDQDLLVTDRASYLYLYLNDGTGHFQPVRFNRIATRPYAYGQLHGDFVENQMAIAAADLNGDGRVDFVTGGDISVYNFNWEGKVDLWLNDGPDAAGKPAFSSAGVIGSAGRDVRGLAVGQLNPGADQTVDVLFGNYEGGIYGLFADTRDTDGDGIIDRWDNAPLDANAPVIDMNTDGLINRLDQLDNDGDGVGDPADDDDDNDGTSDATDNCPFAYNPDQADSDGDGIGDVCDPLLNRDSDGDGVPDTLVDPALRLRAQQAKAAWSRNDTHFIIRVDSLSRLFQNEFVQTFLDSAILTPEEWATRKGENYNGLGDTPAPAGYAVPAGLSGGRNLPVTVFVIPKLIWASSPDSDPIRWINNRIVNPNLEIGQHGTYHAFNTTIGSWKDQTDRNMFPCETCGFSFPEMYEYLRVGKDTLQGTYGNPWLVQTGATPASARINWGIAANPLISYAPPYDASDIPSREAVARLGYVAFSASVWEENHPVFSPEGSHHQQFDQFGMYHASADRQVDPVGADAAAFRTYLASITRKGALNTWLIEQSEWSGRYCNDLPRLVPCAASPDGTNVENNVIEPGRWEKWLTLLDFAKDNGGVMTMGDYALAMSFDNAPTVANPDQHDGDHNGIGDAIDGARLTAGEIALSCNGEKSSGNLATLLATPLGSIPAQQLTFTFDADGDGVGEVYPAVTDDAGKAIVPVTTTYPVGSVIPFTAGWDGILVTASATGSARVTAQVTGLLPPLVGLVPVDKEPPLPDHSFRQGRVVPLKLSLACGTRVLTAADVAPPTVTAIERSGDAVNLATVNTDAGAANDNGYSFRFADGAWIYNLDTTGLGTGSYKLTIRMPDGTSHVAALVLR